MDSGLKGQTVASHVDAILELEQPRKAVARAAAEAPKKSFDRKASVRRSGPVGVDWASIAHSAGRQLDAAPSVERPALTVALAAQHHLSTHYFRRIVALRALLTNKRFARLGLSALPLSTAEIVRRWADHDPAAACEAVRKVLAGEMDASKIPEAEQKSRSLKSIASGTTSASRRFREQLKDWATQKYSGTGTLLKQGPGFESLLRLRCDSGQKIEHVVFVTIGAYTDPTLEKKRVKETLLQALGLRQYNDQVIMVCATERAKRIAQDFVEQNHIDSKLVAIRTGSEVLST